MGGIISGFMGGGFKAMADAGRLMFNDKLRGERDEAEFLRDSELRKDIAAEDRSFRTSERTAGQEFTATQSGLDRKSRESIAAERLKGAEKDGRTNQEKNAASLRAKGYPPEIADAIAHGALEVVKDMETGDSTLVNPLGKPVGRLTSIDGKPMWLEEGEQTPNADVTSTHRKEAKEKASGKAGTFRTDKTDFPETKGDRKLWERQEAQRLANEEREAENKKKKKTGDGKKKPGIVGSKIDNTLTKVPKTDLPDPGLPKANNPDTEVKYVGAREMTKLEFVSAMVRKHGKGKMAQIEETWESIKGK